MTEIECENCPDEDGNHFPCICGYCTHLCHCEDFYELWKDQQDDEF
jgi:hypothetical protein